MSSTLNPPLGSSPLRSQAMARRSLEEHKLVLAMVGLQVIYAITGLTAKAALSQGISPMVFITYRQAIAAVALLPTTLIARRGRASGLALGVKGFCLVFTAALVGGTVNMAFYYRGLQLGSASTASAVANTIPAITFMMAACIGLEKVQIKSPRSMAKVLGTIICVGGAIFMALFKGPKFLNTEFQTLASMFHTGGEDWVMGCLFILGSNCCWSLWLILQVPICKSYLDPLSLSTWMCVLASFQSASIAFILEPDLKAWRINSMVLLCLLFAGLVGSAVTYYFQSWCIARKGPLFTAMFSPLCTVIVTVLASLLLHEELYVGGLVGAAAVVGGLYIVLWGKAGDFNTKIEPCLGEDNTKILVSIDESLKNDETDIKEPLLIN